MKPGRQGAPLDLRQTLVTLLPDLRGYARFLALDRVEADDLVQDALTRALAALDGFTPDPDKPEAALKAWCFTILRNTFYANRRRGRIERGVLTLVSGEAEARSGGQEAHADLSLLARAMAQLPDEQREALVLVGAQGLDYAAAAAVCGTAVGTVKARVSRARARLAVLLDAAAPAHLNPDA
jgi:RNA polymerase sigma-70 factor (ECF subfamily)